jgi:hypothetical protein
MAALQEFFDKVGADESSTTGHHESHEAGVEGKQKVEGEAENEKAKARSPAEKCLGHQRNYFAEVEKSMGYALARLSRRAGIGVSGRASRVEAEIKGRPLSIVSGL